MAVCYRHPDRETGVSCSNCGNPICPDCMTPTPVGMRCPECSKQTTNVRNVAASYNTRPVVTTALIAINALVFLGMSTQSGGGDQIRADLGLFGPAVADGQWYRLVTNGFLHFDLIHIGFNMYILWFLGNMLEPTLGPVRFGALYAASLLAGSFGALLLSPNALTAGASGAVFGLLGAAFITQRARGIDPMQSGIGLIILINLAFTLLRPNISLGGHLGGLIGGVLVALAIEQSTRYTRKPLASVAICAVVGAVAVAGSFAVA